MKCSKYLILFVFLVTSSAYAENSQVLAPVEDYLISNPPPHFDEQSNDGDEDIEIVNELPPLPNTTVVSVTPTPTPRPNIIPEPIEIEEVVNRPYLCPIGSRAVCNISQLDSSGEDCNCEKTNTQSCQYFNYKLSEYGGYFIRSNGLPLFKEDDLKIFKQHSCMVKMASECGLNISNPMTIIASTENPMFNSGKGKIIGDACLAHKIQMITENFLDKASNLPASYVNACKKRDDFKAKYLDPLSNVRAGIVIGGNYCHKPCAETCMRNRTEDMEKYQSCIDSCYVRCFDPIAKELGYNSYKNFVEKEKSLKSAREQVYEACLYEKNKVLSQIGLNSSCAPILNPSGNVCSVERAPVDAHGNPIN